MNVWVPRFASVECFTIRYLSAPVRNAGEPFYTIYEQPLEHETIMSQPAEHRENVRRISEAIPLRFVTAASLFDGHDASINIMRASSNRLVWK